MNRVDDQNRTIYGPGDERPFWDHIFPRRHGKFWNYNWNEKRSKTYQEIRDSLIADSEDKAKLTLEHVQAIAASATDRAAAADRRATTIAGTVSIAASFTLSGAGLLVDKTKITDATVRQAIAIVLAVTAVAFVLAAFYALRALVATRAWNWSEPYDLPTDRNESLEEQLGQRAAHLLDDFARNWEIADQKNRNVDIALRALVLGLAGIAGIAILLAQYVVGN